MKKWTRSSLRVITNKKKEGQEGNIAREIKNRIIIRTLHDFIEMSYLLVILA